MNLLSVVVVTASLLTLAWRQTLVHAENARPVELYVATNGNDKWSGKLATPIKSRTDGPFATVQRARDQLRTLKEKNALPGGARVLVRGGVYALKETLQFRPQDSGVAGAPIVYQNYRNEKSVLSGGTRITGWKVVNDKATGKRWIATLPEVQGGAWNFAQLFVNGERRYRPLLPKNGYYHIAHAVGPSPKTGGKGHDRFAYRTGDVNPNWHNVDDVEFLMMQVWTMARMRAANIDTQNNIVTFSARRALSSGMAPSPKATATSLKTCARRSMNRANGISTARAELSNTSRVPAKRHRTQL
jgi:hypothetical protein